MANKRVKSKEVGIYITKYDADIVAFILAARFGEAGMPKQSRSLHYWLTALILAEIGGASISIRDPLQKIAKPQPAQSMGSSMFGIGSTQSTGETSDPIAEFLAKSKYPPGSIVTIHFYNKIIIRHLNNVQQHTMPLSAYIKLLIRRAIRNPSPPTSPEEIEAIIQNTVASFTTPSNYNGLSQAET